MKFQLLVAIISIALTEAKVLDNGSDLQKIYENINDEMETQLRSSDGFKFSGHKWISKNK